MAKFEDRQALNAKIEWEGGLVGALEYGVKPDDMPEDDKHLFNLWLELSDAFEIFKEIAERVEDLLDE